MNETVYFFKIRVASKNIEVECRNKIVFNQCRRFLTEFEMPDLLIKVSPQELEAEAMRLPPMEESHEGVATSRHYGQLENKIIFRKIAEGLLGFDTFLMHGATIAREDQAYTITAPSHTGKTTRSKLWLDVYPDSIVVCDDKPFIKVTDSEVIACGSPWCGKEGWTTNTMVPLKAIFFLERAESDEEDSVKEISLQDAFPFLMQQIYRPADSKGLYKTVQLLKALDGRVKLYKFRSHPTAEAVRLAYETACSK